VIALYRAWINLSLRVRADTGGCVHDIHLLQHAMPVRSNPACWPAPTSSNHPADYHVRASFQTWYTGQLPLGNQRRRFMNRLHRGSPVSIRLYGKE